MSDKTKLRPGDLVVKRMGGRDVVYHEPSGVRGQPISQCGAFWYTPSDFVTVSEAERQGVRPCLRCFPSEGV